MKTSNGSASADRPACPLSAGDGCDGAAALLVPASDMDRGRPGFDISDQGPVRRLTFEFEQMTEEIRLSDYSEDLKFRLAYGHTSRWMRYIREAHRRAIEGELRKIFPVSSSACIIGAFLAGLICGALLLHAFMQSTGGAP